jgi:hypothetical protein
LEKVSDNESLPKKKTGVMFYDVSPPSVQTAFIMAGFAQLGNTGGRVGSPGRALLLAVFS